MSFFFKKSSKARDVEDGAQFEDISIEEGSAVAEEMENNDDVTANDDGHGAFNATVIMPCVSGLAQRINDSHALQQQFEENVAKNADAYEELSHYCLNNDQWDLAEDLADALELFEEPTKKFLQEGVPLIVDVLPLLYELKLSMEAIQDSNIDPACNISSSQTSRSKRDSVGDSLSD
ncbi:hypothetical protein NP233_g12525 [Leucocoprinus birnbaumii]|uniref:Uncharacterized protein n=1 Tax=Leucocoprinus birnbaumii TaxID=56174 RepID=A0AAD5VFI4_9AGAR|nr:hypothetical protein NP233_g12525 [Leucocoprinus birnbaumii]